MSIAFAILLALLDPVPKVTDEPLAWVYNEKKSEICFYTSNGNLHLKYKMPDGENFQGIYDGGKKVLFQGKDGNQFNREKNQIGSYHVRPTGNQEEGTDLRIPIDMTDYRSWIFMDDLSCGIGAKYVQADKSYDQLAWDAKTGKIKKVDLPSDFSVRGWIDQGKTYMGYRSQASGNNRYYKIPVRGGDADQVIPFEKEYLVISNVSSDDRFVLAYVLVSKQPWEMQPYLYDLEKKTKKQIANHPTCTDIRGSFSPDGKLIVYRAFLTSFKKDGKEFFPTEIIICKADGREPVSILKSEEQLSVTIGWIPSKKAFQFVDVVKK